MGSFAELYFSEYPISGTKNYLDQWIFKESDKRVFQRNLSGDDGVETVYAFETTVETSIKRLEVMGYTIECCKNDFEHKINEELKD